MCVHLCFLVSQNVYGASDLLVLREARIRGSLGHEMASTFVDPPVKKTRTIHPIFAVEQRHCGPRPHVRLYRTLREFGGRLHAADCGRGAERTRDGEVRGCTLDSYSCSTLTQTTVQSTELDYSAK